MAVPYAGSSHDHTVSRSPTGQAVHAVRVAVRSSQLPCLLNRCAAAIQDIAQKLRSKLDALPAPASGAGGSSTVESALLVGRLCQVHTRLVPVCSVPFQAGQGMCEF